MSKIKYCPICEKPNDIYEIICSKCKYDFNRNINEHEITELRESYKNEFSSKKKNINTKWLNFYIYARFPISIFLRMLYIINYSFFDKVAYAGNLLFGLIMDIPILILMIFTYLEMKKFSNKGYKLNFIIIVGECLLYSLSKTVVESIVFSILWIVPNFIYFIKRKNMFYIPIKGNGINTKKRTFCPKCGARLYLNCDCCMKCGLVVFRKRVVIKNDM